MEHKVVRDSQYPRDWRVEAFDECNHCFVTIFIGRDAEARAREYARFKNQ